MAQMRATMEAAPGVGLDASQVGVPMQLVVLRDGPGRWGQLTDAEQTARELYDGVPSTVLLNPASPADRGRRAPSSFYEGCLSFPGLSGVVARHRVVRVEALDEHGEPVDRVYSGWAARFVQHEVDHGRGCLHLDRVETRSLSTIGSYERLWAGRPAGRRGCLPRGNAALETGAGARAWLRSEESKDFCRTDLG